MGETQVVELEDVEVVHAALVAARDRLTEVLKLHAERFRDGDGFTLRWCRECNQNYPCPTVTVLSGHADAGR